MKQNEHLKYPLWQAFSALAKKMSTLVKPPQVKENNALTKSFTASKCHTTATVKGMFKYLLSINKYA